MNDVMKSVGCLVLFLVLLAGLDYSGLMWQSFIGPKKENIRRQIFEETRSYNQGKMQDLIKYMHEYKMSKSEEDKQAIAATIRQQFSDYDEINLTPELRSFLVKIKYE